MTTAWRKPGRSHRRAIRSPTIDPSIPITRRSVSLNSASSSVADSARRSSGPGIAVASTRCPRSWSRPARKPVDGSRSPSPGIRSAATRAIDAVSTACRRRPTRKSLEESAPRTPQISTEIAAARISSNPRRITVRSRVSTSPETPRLHRRHSETTRAAIAGSAARMATTSSTLVRAEDVA